MSKKFLKEQAKELLSFQLRQIKGGMSGIVEECTLCSTGCSSSCSVACIKGKSRGQQI